MFRRYCLVASILVLLVGCTKTARLYDLETGEQIAVSYHGGSRGQLSTSFRSGESFSGEYSTVVSGAVGWGNIYASVYSPAGVASGSGSSASLAVAGPQRGSAILTGNRGTVVTCEYVSGTLGGHGTGGCVDNHGKKYKLMF